jgi:hypothetical protein
MASYTTERVVEIMQSHGYYVTRHGDVYYSEKGGNRIKFYEICGGQHVFCIGKWKYRDPYDAIDHFERVNELTMLSKQLAAERGA